MYYVIRHISGKPVIANKGLIPASEAGYFPKLNGLISLAGETDIEIFDILRDESKYKADDQASGCTLCAISYKQFGFKQLQSWINPFSEALCHGIGSNSRAGRAKVIQLSITEGGFVQNLIKGLMLSSMKSSTPKELHDSSLVYFGKKGDTLEFKQNLRMYNTLVGYVVLVDDLGRVRWMSSGEANEEELGLLIDCALSLTPVRPLARNTKLK